LPITVEMLQKGAERYPGTELLIARAQGKRAVASASPSARVERGGHRGPQDKGILMALGK
jgi:hypothetical protein